MYESLLQDEQTSVAVRPAAALLYYEMAEVQHDVGFKHHNTAHPELEESALADAARHGHAAANVRRPSVTSQSSVSASSGPHAERGAARFTERLLNGTQGMSQPYPHNNASSAPWSSTPPFHRRRRGGGGGGCAVGDGPHSRSVS
jgi:hypothetical protein